MRFIGRSHRAVLLVIAIVTASLIVGCGGIDSTPAGPISDFNDKIEEYTPDVNITPLSSGSEANLDTAGMPLDQVNPLSTKTTINAGQAGTFSISFARFSEAKGIFEEQARCNGKPNAIGLTRPISEIPNVIFRVLSLDKDSAFNCKTTKGIIIDVDSVGFIETQGTTIRVVLGADKKARIAVFSGLVMLTPKDEYGSAPIMIREHTEVLVDVIEREIQPPTPATFSMEETREFKALDDSINPAEETDPLVTLPPPTLTQGQDTSPTSTLAPTPTLIPTLTPTSTPVPTITPAPVPTITPTPVPTITPAPVPTITPTPAPTATPAENFMLLSPTEGQVATDIMNGFFGSDVSGIEGVVQVEYSVDGVLRFLGVAGPNFNADFISTLVGNGAHTVQGIAIDAAGNKLNVSNIVNIEVQN